MPVKIEEIRYGQRLVWRNRTDDPNNDQYDGYTFEVRGVENGLIQGSWRRGPRNYRSVYVWAKAEECDLLPTFEIKPGASLHEKVLSAVEQDVDRGRIASWFDLDRSSINYMLAKGRKDRERREVRERIESLPPPDVAQAKGMIGVVELWVTEAQFRIPLRQIDELLAALNRDLKAAEDTDEAKARSRLIAELSNPNLATRITQTRLSRTVKVTLRSRGKKYVGEVAELEISDLNRMGLSTRSITHTRKVLKGMGLDLGMKDPTWGKVRPVLDEDSP